MKKLVVLISCVLMVSCASTKIKKRLPIEAYNIQKVSRKCYIFDADGRNQTYRYIVWSNKEYYELYGMKPMSRIRKGQYE